MRLSPPLIVAVEFTARPPNHLPSFLAWRNFTSSGLEDIFAPARPVIFLRRACEIRLRALGLVPVPLRMCLSPRLPSRLPFHSLFFLNMFRANGGYLRSSQYSPISVPSFFFFFEHAFLPPFWPFLRPLLFALLGRLLFACPARLEIFLSLCTYFSSMIMCPFPRRLFFTL